VQTKLAGRTGDRPELSPLRACRHQSFVAVCREPWRKTYFGPDVAGTPRPLSRRGSRRPQSARTTPWPHGAASAERFLLKFLSIPGKLLSKPSEKKLQKQRQRKDRLRKQRAAQATQEAAADMLHEAIYHSQNGNPQACITSVRKYLRFYPQNAEALELYGSASMKIKDVAGERDACLKLLELKPESPRYFCNLLTIEFRSRNYLAVLDLIDTNTRAIAACRKDGYWPTVNRLQNAAQSAIDRVVRTPRKDPTSGDTGRPAQPADATAPPTRETPRYEFPRLEPDLRIQYGTVSSPPDITSTNDGRDNDVFWLRQRLRWEHIRMQQEFEELLCLSTLTGVDHLGYQIETVRKALRIFHGRVLLADEVGLGKTIEACMIVKEYLLRGMARRVLILSPPSLVGQWAREMSGKFGIHAVHMTDAALLRRRKDWFWSQPVVIASLQTAKREAHAGEVLAREWDMVVVDEAHHLKNRRTMTWKFVNEIRKKFIVLLSATPVQNDLSELYNMITLLKPGVFPPEKEFKKQYVDRTDPRKPVNVDALRMLIRDVMIRNTRAACGIAFSKRHASTVMVDFTEAESLIYESISRFCREIYGTADARTRNIMRIVQERAGAHLPAALQSLRALQSALSRRDEPPVKHIDEIASLIDRTSHLPDRTAKIGKLIELLSATAEPKIVFCRHAATLTNISAALLTASIHHELFHGGLTAEKKTGALEKFKTGRCNTLLSSESGGEGHNLQFCNTVINFDLPWNPMQIEQRIGRIHRIGQKSDVFIFNLCSRGTLEQNILTILEQKVRMFELVIGEVDTILGRLDDRGGFGDIVFDLWMKNADSTSRERSFEELGNELAEGRNEYLEAAKLEQALFGEDMQT